MNITERTTEKWGKILDPLLTKHKEDLKLIQQSADILPPKELRFRAFKECDVDKAKVVIIGQDPYPRPGDAQGLCFSLPEGRNTPSMRVILKEICDNTRNDYDALRTHPRAFSWEHLPKQGVLLLNTALTVERGNANSHSAYWKGFTEDLVKELSEQRPDLIWVLWGNNAKKLKPHITKAKEILEAPHPMVEIYSGGKGGFYGCKHFSKINKLVDKPIDWINTCLQGDTEIGGSVNNS